MVQLAVVASMAALRAVAGDRLRQPLTPRPLRWILAPARRPVQT